VALLIHNRRVQHDFFHLLAEDKNAGILPRLILDRARGGNIVRRRRARRGLLVR